MDTKVFSGGVGLLRVFTLILGVIDFGFTVDSYLHHYKYEEFFLGVVIVCLILSVISLLLGLLINQPKIRKLDVVYHMIGAALLLISGILFIHSVVRFGSGHFKWYYGERIASGVMGIVNALLYFILGCLLFRQS